MKRAAYYFGLFFLSLLVPAFLLWAAPSAQAVDTWERLDKRLKTQVFQLNVGLKMRLKSGLWIQLSDLSPKYHYPVYSTSAEDKGYRVVGFGTTFPLRSARTDRLYFVTNRHVVDSGDQILKECERFYAGMRLYAEQTATTGDINRRLQELLNIINLSTKKDMNTAERAVYQATADAVWDAYETYLSAKADPSRILFQKYLGQVGLESELSYFLHSSGPVTKEPLKAQLYKAGRAEDDPDLAILSAAAPGILPLEIDPLPPSEGQEIQVIGYPTASDQIDQDSGKYYAPTFHTGRVSRVGAHSLQIDTPITTGNSGGPVISQRGKVLGVVAVRALSARGGELPNFGGAVSAQSVRAFAPELFK